MLFDVINHVNEAHFYGRKLPAEEREAVAANIAKQLGKPGSYAGMFAPTASELKNGIKLFTGERVRPSASLRHVFGEEASRAMLLLKPQAAAARTAARQAANSILSHLRKQEPNKHGMFCCGTCDPALWRHITAGGLKGEEDWIKFGLKAIKAHRKGDGRWRRFPFFYTLLALTEIDSNDARHEMKYAAAECESFLKRAKALSQMANRRKAIIEKVLNLS